MWTGLCRKYEIRERSGDECADTRISVQMLMVAVGIGTVLEPMPSRVTLGQGNSKKAAKSPGTVVLGAVIYAVCLVFWNIWGKSVYFLPDR